jgi:hypothetical protein
LGMGWDTIGMGTESSFEDWETFIKLGAEKRELFIDRISIHGRS